MAQWIAARLADLPRGERAEARRCESQMRMWAEAWCCEIRVYLDTRQPLPRAVARSYQRQGYFLRHDQIES